MKGNDEITDLFRSRLGNAEMPVRNGFWEELQHDLPQPQTQRKHVALTPKFYRISAAASVMLLLGVASAAFWYFSPKEEIKEAFTQVAALTPEGSLNGDIVQESFPSIHQADPVAKKPGRMNPSSGAPVAPAGQGDEEDESVSVSLSFTITQRVYANQRTTTDGRYGHASNQKKQQAASSTASETAVGTETSTDNGVAHAAIDAPRQTSCARNWALKAAVGTSLPKGDFGMPLAAELSIERKLGKRLALEAGLRYAYLPVEGNDDLHALSVPLKLTATWMSTPKVDLYAIVGASAGKLLNKGGDPIQLSALAGLGIRYKLSDRMALFAEPTVSHYFDSGSEVRSLHSERPTTMNLLCGLRVTY